MGRMTFKVKLKGGPGSGHWGHAGRPGMRGGGRAGSSTQIVSGAERRAAKLGKPDKGDTLPQDLRKMTGKQQQDFFEVLKNMPEKELRRRQDINASQIRQVVSRGDPKKGLRPEDELGYANLQIIDRLLIEAIISKLD